MQQEEATSDNNKKRVMIRAMYPSEPELVRRCRAKTWVFVVERKSQETHPIEEETTHFAACDKGNTALSLNVRSRAPLRVLRQLVAENLAQIGVTHTVRGNVLHEALKHRASDHVLEFLVRAAIHFDETMGTKKSDCLLGNIDELGRTALHYMVDRILRALDRGERKTESWNILRLMVEAYPEAVSVIDADGTTPLVLVLLIPKFAHDQDGPDLEREVYCMVKLMLEVCPHAVQVSRRLPRPWHYHFNHDNEARLVNGDGVPSPLSCALLHGRSTQTIEVVLEANRRIGVKACRSVVTHYREVPLHIATSMRCSTDLLCNLVYEDSAALGLPDMHGLVPLDWIWVRHTLDWFSSADPFAPIMVSRRRYIHHHFLDWHSKVSNQYLGFDKSMEESPNPVVRNLSKQLKDDLFKRISIILPEMAAQLQKENNDDDRMDDDHMDNDRMDDDRIYDRHCHRNRFSLVHAAAFVPCPLAMVQLACDMYPDELRTPDERLGRLPLHYASTRGGYIAHYPVGVSCNIHKMVEVSALPLILIQFPAAARATDDNEQLPLHIAIDHAKEAVKKEDHRRRRQEDSGGGEDTARPGHQEILALLQVYPDALQRRDGVTKLFPFQQAAQGHDGDLELAFTLLRRDPSLVQAVL